MNIFADLLKVPLVLWNWITYEGYTGTPLPPAQPEPASRPAPEVIEAELLMLEVDRAGNKIRIAAVRKERKQS